MTDEEVVTDALRCQGLMETDRGTWEAHWQEIAERVLPRDSGMFQGVRTQGDKRTEKMFDATAALALERFAAVMDSMLTPRNQKWHRLRASNAALNKSLRVRRYFDEVTDILFALRYAPKANFASNKGEEYLSLGAYGTGGMFVDKRLPGPGDSKGGFRYKSVHLAEMYFAENFQGMIDTVHRKFEMTARQIVQQFEASRIPQKVMEKAKSKPEEKFEIIHCIKPREDMDPARADYKGMAFASYYILTQEKALLREGGYHTFPYPVSRYIKQAREVYGRSPAMTVLPAIKVLNEQKKTSLKMGHRLADPIILGHDDGVLDAFSLKPGTVVPGGISSQGNKLVQALDMPSGQLPALDKLMEPERQVINDAFFVTLFQILTERPQMTATEVIELTREKGILMAPVMGRQMSESLSPQIDRELDIASDLRMLPEMPPELVEAQGEYNVVFDSPLSRAMRAEEAAGFYRQIELTTTIVNVTQDPSLFDHYNFDEALPELADINAVPARWMATPDQKEEKAAGRQQQAQVQQMIDAGPAAAAMMKVAKGA